MYKTTVMTVIPLVSDPGETSSPRHRLWHCRSVTKHHPLEHKQNRVNSKLEHCKYCTACL